MTQYYVLRILGWGFLFAYLYFLLKREYALSVSCLGCGAAFQTRADLEEDRMKR